MGSKRYKFSRYAMYNNIEKFFKSNELIQGKCLLVGDTLKGSKGNNALTNMLPKGCEITAPDYPGVDMQDMLYGGNSFDYVMADQVLEHVRKPWIGVEEVRRVLKPGGIAVLTTCLMNEVHGIPEDYWRFTPDGLKVLCENFSKIAQCDGMGDLGLVIECLKGGRGQRVIPGQDIEKKALAYDGKHMLHVWIIAIK